MQMKMLRDAVNAAESNIKLAKNLLYQLEEGRGDRFERHDRFDHNDRNDRNDRRDRFDRNRNNDLNRRPQSAAIPVAKDKDINRDRELVGFFNGLEMLTESGKKFIVPRNYISKSFIVEGDTLKLVKDEGEEKFKQIRRVKRKRIVGTLSKKDGDFVVVTELGSFKVIPEAIAFYKAKEEDHLTVLVPAEKKATWASVEGIAVEEKEDIVDVTAEKDDKTEGKEVAPKKKYPKAKKTKEIKEEKSENTPVLEKEVVTPKDSQIIFEEGKEVTPEIKIEASKIEEPSVLEVKSEEKPPAPEHKKSEDDEEALQ
ncbi:hypothetical protein A2250_02050 [candidate division CPR3 bacterium RIFOXYA2_FULL_35_13]|nr:MAG: hypothetical protein A2250_02050 [candidate division CPR3 bacterium RIFOXYA2_FULL_35_13]